MSVPPPAPANSRRITWCLAIPAAVAFAYAFGHLAWYRGTPLGQVPVMDEQETLALAEAIARGELPREPFYRAPFYSFVLAAFRTAGVATENLFHAALVLGADLHVINAVLAARIARGFFGSRAGLIAGLLFALHPVFVHYATQALDATLGLSLFLAGLAAIAPQLHAAPDKVAATGPWLVASIWWALAAITRPNYVLLWVMLPVFAWWSVRRARILACSATLAGAIVFAGLAAWQWRISGTPRVMPWQGAYNLWAANEPGSHGRYYVQKHRLPAAVAALNPARAESIYFYHVEKGAPPKDIDTLNAYWRGRFLDYIRHHPISWLTQLARKGYALLNDWEQYNNKTFAFHKERSPWLRWNPLCWGVLFAAGLAGFARLVHENPRSAAKIAALGAVLAGSVLLFFVSARFRLPLAALAAVLAGGSLAAPGFWLGWTRGARVALIVGVAAAAALAFSSFDGVRDRVTFVQDHALLARAASTMRDDAQAWTHARAALAIQPQHADALRVAAAAYFNQLVAGSAAPAAEPEWRDACTRLLAEPPTDARDLRAVAALALWRGGLRDAAMAEWRGLGGTPSAVSARMILGELLPRQIDFASWPARAWEEPLVRLAALQLNIAPPADVKLGDAARAAAITSRLFRPAGVLERP